MRSTITLEASLLHEVERRAAQLGTTTTRLVESAVRQILEPDTARQHAANDFQLLTYGQGGRPLRYDLDKTSRILALEDHERFG